MKQKLAISCGEFMLDLAEGYDVLGKGTAYDMGEHIAARKDLHARGVLEFT